MSLELRILLTGGTGFFGKSILDFMHRGFLRNIHLTILSRNPAAFKEQNPQWNQLESVSYLSGDIRTFSCGGECFDYVIHAAAPVQERMSSNDLENIVVGGTAHVMEVAEAIKAKRVLFVSSGAVYGCQSVEASLSEDLTPVPNTGYGIAKAKAENICLGSGVPAVIARCFTFVGPYLPIQNNFAVADFIWEAINGSPIVIHGDGTPLRSYMYADDLVSWLFKILEDGRNGQVYNVGSDEPLMILELAHRIKKLLKSSSPVQILNDKPTGRAGAVYIPNVQKARTELGLVRMTSFDEAILKTADYYGKQYKNK